MPYTLSWLSHLFSKQRRVSRKFYNCRKRRTFGATLIHTLLLEEFDAEIKPQSPSYTAGFAADITLERK